MGLYHGFVITVIRIHVPIVYVDFGNLGEEDLISSVTCFVMSTSNWGFTMVCVIITTFKLLDIDVYWCKSCCDWGLLHLFMRVCSHISISYPVV